MKKIMKVIPANITNKWFNKLAKKNKKKLQDIVQEKNGVHLRRELQLTPDEWWAKQNQVQKYIAYQAYEHLFRPKPKPSRSRGVKKPPLKEKEVKENGS